MNTYEKILSFGSDNLIRFGGSYCGGIRLQQSPKEISMLIDFLLPEKENIKSYLEIGAASGGTVYVMNYFLNLNNIYIIDDNVHPAHSLRRQTLKDVNYIEWIGNSQTLEAHNFIKNSGVMFDVVFIDADHSYNGVKNDLINFIEFLRNGGYLIFHDIVTKGCGVGLLVNELKQNNIFGLFYVKEFIDVDKALGIGVFKKCLTK